MSNKSVKYFIIIIAFWSIHAAKSNFKTDIKNKVKELEARSRRLYGDTQGRPMKQWELVAEDPSLYPNGDVHKLAEISHRWIVYYHCTSLMVSSVTASGQLPGVNVVVYEGEVARLPCNLCVAPGEENHVTWFYSKSIHNMRLAPLIAESTVIVRVNVTMYNVRTRRAGIYRCRLGDSEGGSIVLQVLDDQHYHVINAETQHRTGAITQPSSSLQLMTFISWSPWSECSACDRTGRRRQHGMCYVTHDNTKVATTARTSGSVFREFPNGVACQSWLIPAAYRSDRKNIIMIESCKKPCKQVFEVWSKSGELLERANNDRGQYALGQRAPPQPPQPAREVIFAKYRDRVTLICPGTTLRDIPITWRRGTKYMSVGTFGEDAMGRVHLNARDQIVFLSVQDDDANVYSCWQSTALAGVLKLEVWRDVSLANGRPLTVACLTVIAITLLYAVKLLQSKIRHIP